MDFSQFAENIKANLNIDNEDLCNRLGIGMITLENYLSGYAKPPKELLNRAAEVFYSDDEYWQSDTLCPEIEMNCIDTRDISEKMHDRGEFFTVVSDNSMKNSRIFKNDYALISSMEAVNPGDIVLVSVNGEDGILRKFRQNGDTVTLSWDKGEDTYSEEDIYVLGKLISIVSKM